MNIKPKRTRLIVEFKEFQRLPEWPIINSTTPDESQVDPATQKLMLPSPAHGTVLPIRTLVE
jgi:hypothetical protein